MVDVERVLLERNVPIPLRDGTLTYANVWRPAGGDPVPAIMVRTPYTKEVEEINVFSEPRVTGVRGFAIAWWRPDGEDRLVRARRMLANPRPHLTYEDRLDAMSRSLPPLT